MPTVVVTGAARGLGRAIVEELSARGLDVIATDVDERALGVLSSLRGVSTHRLDVTDPADARRVADAVRAVHGGIDGLVNNAGLPGVGSVAETPIETGRPVLDVNVLGPYIVTNAFLPLLHARRGRIVVMGSEAARFPQGFSLYSVSKIAVEAWAAALRQELALTRMRVIIVRPGAHATGLLDEVRAGFDARADDPITGRWMPKVGRIAERPLRKGGDPVDVARAVARALTARRPRRVYEVNTMLAMRLGALVPGRVRDRLVGLLLRLVPGGRSSRRRS